MPEMIKNTPARTVPGLIAGNIGSGISSSIMSAKLRGRFEIKGRLTSRICDVVG
jgi:hypothetical protein